MREEQGRKRIEKHLEIVRNLQERVDRRCELGGYCGRRLKVKVLIYVPDMWEERTVGDEKRFGDKFLRTQKMRRGRMGGMGIKEWPDGWMEGVLMLRIGTWYMSIDTDCIGWDVAGCPLHSSLSGV